MPSLRDLSRPARSDVGPAKVINAIPACRQALNEKPTRAGRPSRVVIVDVRTTRLSAPAVAAIVIVVVVVVVDPDVQRALHVVPRLAVLLNRVVAL